MSLKPDGTPYWSLVAKDGVVRISASCGGSDSMANLSLYDVKGNEKIGITAFGDKEASLAFAATGNGQNGGLALGIAEDSAPTAEIFDGSAKRRLELGTSREGTLGLEFYGSKESPMVQLGLTKENRVISANSCRERSEGGGPARQVGWSATGRSPSRNWCQFFQRNKKHQFQHTTMRKT